MRSSSRMRNECFLLRKLLAGPAVAALLCSTFLALGHTHGMESVCGRPVPYRAPPLFFFGLQVLEEGREVLLSRGMRLQRPLRKSPKRVEWTASPCD